MTPNTDTNIRTDKETRRKINVAAAYLDLPMTQILKIFGEYLEATIEKSGPEGLEALFKKWSKEIEKDGG